MTNNLPNVGNLTNNLPVIGNVSPVPMQSTTPDVSVSDIAPVSDVTDPVSDTITPVANADQPAVGCAELGRHGTGRQPLGRHARPGQRPPRCGRSDRWVRRNAYERERPGARGPAAGRQPADRGGLLGGGGSGLPLVGGLTNGLPVVGGLLSGGGVGGLVQNLPVVGGLASGLPVVGGLMGGGGGLTAARTAARTA